MAGFTRFSGGQAVILGVDHQCANDPFGRRKIVIQAGCAKSNPADKTIRAARSIDILAGIHQREICIRRVTTDDQFAVGIQSDRMSAVIQCSTEHSQHFEGFATGTQDADQRIAIRVKIRLLNFVRECDERRQRRRFPGEVSPAGRIDRHAPNYFTAVAADVGAVNQHPGRVQLGYKPVLGIIIGVRLRPIQKREILGKR